MRNLRELTDIFLDRVRKSMPPGSADVPDEGAGAIEVLKTLASRPGYKYHLMAGTLDLWKSSVSDTMVNMAGFFRKLDMPRVASTMDYDSSVGALTWLNRVGRYAIETGDWSFVRPFDEILILVFRFFHNADSIYVRSDGDYIETRMKGEFGFIEANTWLSTAVLNSVWHEYLSFLSLMGSAYPNIKLSGPVEEVLTGLSSSFAHDFWDDESGEIRFGLPDNGKARSGYCVLAMDSQSGGLLYKQKRKRYLKTIESDYYSDLGILERKGDNDTVRPELLPVYWTAKLRTGGFGASTRKDVSDLVRKHFGRIDLAAYRLSDGIYNNAMLEFFGGPGLDFLQN